MKADDFCIYFAESTGFFAVNLSYAFLTLKNLKKFCQAFLKTICDFEENLSLVFAAVFFGVSYAYRRFGYQRKVDTYLENKSRIEAIEADMKTV